MAWSAARPCSCHSAYASVRKSLDSLLREPLGRPAGLPEWPGLNNQGFCCASVLSVFGPRLLPLFGLVLSSIQVPSHPLVKFGHRSKPVSCLVFTAHRIQFWLLRSH